MWHSFYSTGVEEFDVAHEQIDAMLGNLAGVNTPDEEKGALIDICCVIIAHIKFKNDLLGTRISREEQEEDANFLRKVRGTIKEREQGRISRVQLVTELRHSLIGHAARYKNSGKHKA
jgi:hypothetical protein